MQCKESAANGGGWGDATSYTTAKRAGSPPGIEVLGSCWGRMTHRTEAVELDAVACQAIDVWRERLIVVRECRKPHVAVPEVVLNARHTDVSSEGRKRRWRKMRWWRKGGGGKGA